MKKLFLFSIYPAAQIILSLLIGYFALNLSAPSDIVRNGAEYIGVDFSGMDVENAAAVIENIGKRHAETGMASFEYDNTLYAFHFDEIGLTADFSRIGPSLSVKGSPAYLNNLFTAFVRNYGGPPKPEFSADADAFRKKLYGIKTYIDKEPVNADIEYTADGNIILSPSKNGVYLDIDKRFDDIYSKFLSEPSEVFAFDSNTATSDSALVIVEPSVTDAYLRGIDTALARLQTPIPAGYDISLVARAAEAVNKVWTPAKGKAYAPFSFLRYIDEAGLSVDNNTKEYNLVASTLMHALLVSGSDYAKIEYTKSADINAYTGLPGFGVELASPDGGAPAGANSLAGRTAADFLFMNTLDGNIVIFASVTDNELNIAVAGKKALAGAAAAPYEIKSEIGDGRATLYRNGKKISEYTQQ